MSSVLLLLPREERFGQAIQTSTYIGRFLFSFSPTPSPPRTPLVFLQFFSYYGETSDSDKRFGQVRRTGDFFSVLPLHRHRHGLPWFSSILLLLTRETSDSDKGFGQAGPTSDLFSVLPRHHHRHGLPWFFFSSSLINERH